MPNMMIELLVYIPPKNEYDDPVNEDKYTNNFMDFFGQYQSVDVQVTYEIGTNKSDKIINAKALDASGYNIHGIIQTIKEAHIYALNQDDSFNET